MGTAASPKKAATTQSWGPEAEELWAALTDRKRCGLLLGCPFAEELVALGPEVAAQAAARLASNGGDRHWRFALARALTRSRHPGVQAWQAQALSHRQWILRAYGAVGIGRNSPETFRSQNTEWAQKETHPGAQLGILWGATLARIKDARKSLVQRISNLPSGPDIRLELLAMDATRQMSLVECLPTVRNMLQHPNFFVTRDAIITLKSLLDHTSIPLLIPLLSHERELVRKPALETLKKLTGLRNKYSQKAFESWCSEHCDPKWPRPETPAAPP